MNPDVTNDDFLMRMQPEVRPEFAEALAQTLHRQARTQRQQQRVLTAVAMIVLALSALMALPVARAAVLHLIREVGGMTFIECDTFETCTEVTNAMRLEYTAAQGQELANGTYRIEMIVDDLPFWLSLPEFLPQGYIYDNLVHLTREGDDFAVILNWYPGDCTGADCDAAITLVTSQILASAADMVPEGVESEAICCVPDGYATLYHDPAGESGITWCAPDPAFYSEEDLCYRLSWFDPELTVNPTMIKVARSLVPAVHYGDSQQILFSELKALFPEIVDFLPTWVPEGFSLDPTWIVTGKYQSSVGVIWSTADSLTEGATAPWFSISIWEDHLAWTAKEGTLQELEIDGHPAALFEHSASSPDHTIYSLMWRQYGLQYSLSWAEVVSTEDMLRLAESVPEKSSLPLPPDQVDDLLRLLLTDGALKLHPMYPPGPGPESE